MKKGDCYRGFTVSKTSNVNEIGVKVIDLVHDKSGARVVHVECDDKENLFALTCKTYPENSHGTSHVLEHVVLCGSEKFPVFDPFFGMTRRSLNTFMNAFTAKLWTAYPAASKNEKDFYNLLEVYLDAVFHPRIQEISFNQEGHRLEFADAHDANSDLTYKGIVFNEMKGAYASPGSVFWRKSMAGLCKGSTYGHDSGGDPKEIPMLTHKELCNFHKKYYHPSRTIFFFYGNLSTENHLDFIGEMILDKAEKKSPIPPIKLINRFKAPVKEETTYPISDEDLSRKSFIGFSYLTTNIKDRHETMALSLLDSILMDTDASLLKHKLITSGLCINVDSAFDTDAREMPYSFIFRGCEGSDADIIEDLLRSTLEEIVENKIPNNLIESALHQLEFNGSEIAGDHGPYGLEIFGKTVLPLLQGGSLIDSLKIHSNFDKLRKLIKDLDYLPSLIKKHFLNNSHMYRLVMNPDSTLSKKLHKEEKESLEEIKNKLSKSEIKEILQNAEIMKAYREEKETEDLSCLPIVSLNDIPNEASYFALKKTTHDNLVVYRHEAFTNKITYATMIFDLPQVEEVDLPYLRLFASLLTELGAGGRNYLDNLNHIQEHIGGVWTSLSLNVQRENIQTCYPTISICAKALSRNNKEMMQILKDFILDPDLKDQERVKELICQAYTNLQNRLNSSAASYALTESAASFSSWNHINNVWHGHPYYSFIEGLYNNIDTQIETIMEKFNSLATLIFHLNNPNLLLTCDNDDFNELEKAHFYGIVNLAKASTPFIPWVESPTPRSAINSARTIATQIAHNAQSLSTKTMLSPQAAPLKIASYIMDNQTVHVMVREKGGAYTSGVRHNVHTGSFQFFSSRDPNILSTYTAFNTAVELLCNGSFTEQDLLEAKLSYIQDVDGVVSRGSLATVTYFQLKVGLTREVRNKFRKEMLSVTKEDVIAAAKECLKPMMKENSIRVTYSSRDHLEREAPNFKKHGIPSLKLESR